MDQTRKTKNQTLPFGSGRRTRRDRGGEKPLTGESSGEWGRGENKGEVEATSERRMTN